MSYAFYLNDFTKRANIKFMIELADPYEGTSTISMIDKI